MEDLRVVLECRGVRLSAANLGGTEGRKPHFLSDTEIVYLKRLGGRQNSPVQPEAP